MRYHLGADHLGGEIWQFGMATPHNGIIPSFCLHPSFLHGWELERYSVFVISVWYISNLEVQPWPMLPERPQLHAVLTAAQQYDTIPPTCKFRLAVLSRGGKGTDMQIHSSTEATETWGVQVHAWKVDHILASGSPTEILIGDVCCPYQSYKDTLGSPARIFCLVTGLFSGIEVLGKEWYWNDISSFSCEHPGEAVLCSTFMWI